MDLRSQLAALFNKPQVPQQPDSPLVGQIPTDTGPMALPRDLGDGPMNDEDLVSMLNGEVGGGRPPPPGHPLEQRPPAPMQDQAGMDDLMMQLQNPDQGITQGQNMNIDDETRARALAQVAALRG